MTTWSLRQLPISRRKFLGLGAGAVAAVGFGSAAHSTPFGSYLYEPEVRSSANGFLSTRLRAAPGLTVADRQIIGSYVYEGSFPGPTLRVRPGDFLRIELINDLPEETNLHVHGFHVSPLTPSDNVLLHIPAGERFTYEYTIPSDHPAGTYFYHPHLHGLASDQTFKGMSGMIIIEGDIDRIPGIAGLPERVMVLQRTAIVGREVPTVTPGNSFGAGDALVNGGRTPIMFIRPGETQRWRLLNATIASLWKIRIEHHPLTLISQDGNTLASAVTLDSVDIATAQRRDVLVQGGSPGVYRVQYQDLQGPFPAGTPQPFVDLAYLVVTGPAEHPQPLPTTLIPFLDLRTLPLSRAPRAITFQIDPTLPPPPDPNPFTPQGFVIDGKFFDEHRVDQFAQLGATEEWTVFNDTGLAHPFHIHINPYQVVAINGQPYEALSYEDTTPVPRRAGGPGTPQGSITFRTRFLDFPGTWVFHCHILGHEDGGMMGIIQVS